MVWNHFWKKNFTGGPPKAPEKFKNPYFQILIFWGPKVNDFLILVMVGGLEPFLEKKFYWGTPQAPKKFKNPHFQILIFWIKWLF